MTRVVINAPLVGPERAGPAVHLTELVRAMLEVRPELHVRTRHASLRGRTAHRASAARIDQRVQARTVPVPTTVLRPLQSTLRFPAERLLSGPYDVFHQFHTDADPAVPDRKLVVTLHDTVAIDWPDAEGAMYAGAGRVLRRCAAVLTGSHFSKDAICAAFDVDPDRVHVGHYGVDHVRFRPAETPGPVPGSPAGTAPYLLFAGGQTPRKNLTRAVAAFARARDRPGLADLRLVLAGPVSAAEPELRAQAPRGLPAEALVFAGHVSDDDLVALYQGAEALLFPSLYEGFGMPVLEAMACGTPVVAGAGSALSEIAGPAAEMVDPTDVDAIAAGIARLLTEAPQQRVARRTRGLDHAATFTWRRCAEEVLAVYDGVADRRRR